MRTGHLKPWPPHLQVVHTPMHQADPIDVEQQHQQQQQQQQREEQREDDEEEEEVHVLTLSPWPPNL